MSEAALFSRFRSRFGRAPEFTANAGGRVNIIGEHTDYHEGFVLPAALDLRTTALAAARTDGMVRVWSENLKEETQAKLGPAKGPVDAKAIAGWKGYALGPFLVLRDAGVPFAGADVWLKGDVPLGGGLSSSASIEVALTGIGAAMADHAMKPFDIALMARKVEHEYCGVPCGIMDQAAAACGSEGHALLIDCRSLKLRLVAFPTEWSIVVADSGVRHALASSEYAKRQRECAAGIEIVRRTHPEVGNARDLDMSILDEARAMMDDVSFRRLRHVVTENQRTLAAVQALETGGVQAMGRLMAESHESLARDYEVSRPELDTLVDLAYGLDGVVGARLTGAGFGGNTVNLVLSESANDFGAALADGYRSRTGLKTDVRIVTPSGGLSVSRL
ncbi:MAG: galactokinase [Deltaproteobacteria bacterium]|nr:galactokinase [Deltaproteobacteria bacterium]